MTPAPEPNGVPRRRRSDLAPREVVAFRLAEQDFCVDIRAVREIRRWSPPTALPNAPDGLSGLVNLRGAVLPIVDLGRRLGLAAARPTERHVIIVVDCAGQVAGLVVDGVSDILSLREEDIRPAPRLAGDAGAGPIEAIATLGERMLRVLDPAQVLAPPGEAA